MQTNDGDDGGVGDGDDGGDDEDEDVGCNGNAQITERTLQPSPASCRIGITGRHTTTLLSYHAISCHTTSTTLLPH